MGKDSQFESVTLQNFGSSSVQLAGWKVRDAAGYTWSLAELGSLAPMEAKTLERAGKEMALSNDGDRVELLNHLGALVHCREYEAVREGEEVIFD